MKPMKHIESIAAAIFPETSLSFVEALGTAHVFHRFGINRPLAEELSALLFPQKKHPNSMRAHGLLLSHKFLSEDIQTLFDCLPIKEPRS